MAKYYEDVITYVIPICVYIYIWYIIYLKNYYGYWQDDMNNLFILNNYFNKILKE